MMISRCLRYCFAVVAMCFGGIAMADTGFGESYKFLGYQVVSAFESASAYGHDAALFDARQAEMYGSQSSMLSSTAGLMKNSHGFLQATADEVAKGTTGSTVSLIM